MNIDKQDGTKSVREPSFIRIFLDAIASQGIHDIQVTTYIRTKQSASHLQGQIVRPFRQVKLIKEIITVIKAITAYASMVAISFNSAITTIAAITIVKAITALIVIRAIQVF